MRVQGLEALEQASTMRGSRSPPPNGLAGPSEALASFLADAAARLPAAPSLYEPLVGAMRAGVLGCAAGADVCSALLARPSMQPLAPHLSLLVADYVTSQVSWQLRLRCLAAPETPEET